MKNKVRRRGQKFIRKFSRVSVKASEEGRDHIKENLIERISHIANIRLLIVEWSLLVIALILLAITQAFWFGSSYSENVFSAGGTYTEATLGEVKTMNPLFANTSSEKALSRLMFATLVANDYSGHPGLNLAESLQANEDATVWTLKLRDGLKWSDGEPITVDDVIFTIGIMKNSAVDTVYDSNLANVKVTTDEENNIVFTLPTTYTDFIVALDFPILPKHILGDVDPLTLIEHSFSNSPVTSGAFSFNAMQPIAKEGEAIYYLSANDNYYDEKSLLNTFAIHTYATKDEIINALNSGLVSATAELSSSDADQIASNQFNQRNTSLNSGAFIFFNTAHEAVKNPELRAAVREGIDLDKIRSMVPETNAVDYPILPEQINLSRYPEIPSRNYDSAKEKINSFSSEGKIHLDVVTVNSGYLPNVANVVKEELEGLGFEVDVTAYDESQEFINEVIARRSYDILIYEIELGVAPDLLPYYHSSQANTSGLNLSNYKNALVDDFLLGARDATDQELKMKKYESFLEYWVTGVPAIGLYQPNLTYYYNKNVRPFREDNKLVTALDRFSDANNWAVVKETKNKTP